MRYDKIVLQMGILILFIMLIHFGKFWEIVMQEGYKIIGIISNEKTRHLVTCVRKGNKWYLRASKNKEMTFWNDQRVQVHAYLC